MDLPRRVYHYQTINRKQLLFERNHGEQRKLHLIIETQTITLNQKDIKDIAIDKENWNTTIMFPDNSTLNIPTIGTSINQFIGFVNINPSKYNPLAAEVRLNLPGGGAIKTIVHTKKDIKHPI